MFLNGMWVPRRLKLRLCDDLQFKRARSTWQGEISFWCLQWWWLAQGTRERPSYGEVADWYKKSRSAPNLCGRQKGTASESLSSRPEPLVQIEAAPVGTFSRVGEGSRNGYSPSANPKSVALSRLRQIVIKLVSRLLTEGLQFESSPGAKPFAFKGL